MLKATLSGNQGIAKKSSSGSNNKLVCKEFSKTWSQDVAFDKTVDRSAFEMKRPDQAGEINEQILVLHKTKTNDGTRSSFLAKLAGDSMEFIQEQRARMAKARQEERICHNSMTAMTEQVYELLRSYAFELNGALGFGPLHIAGTNPKTVSEVVKFNRLRQPEETVTYVRARLSTPSYSLIMRGDKNGIQFFIMPVARAIGLSIQESQFVPVLRLRCRMENGSVSWDTERGQALTPSMIEVICMNLFQRLIEETKEQVRVENEENEFAASSVC